jgi:hypothetical protein
VEEVNDRLRDDDDDNDGDDNDDTKHKLITDLLLSEILNS